jgi:hypothetical protein
MYLYLSYLSRIQTSELVSWLGLGIQALCINIDLHTS